MLRGSKRALLSKLVNEIQDLVELDKSKTTIYTGLPLKNRLRIFWGKVKRKVSAQRSQVPLVLPQAVPSPPPETSPQVASSKFSNLTLQDFWNYLDPIIDAQEKDIPLEQEPQISVITPTYNSSLDWFIETAISVINQSTSQWEWCLVDDGSTKTEIREALIGLADRHPRIKVAFQESSAGISGSTNRAIEMAKAPYVCFLDHDDTLSPDALEISLAKLAEGFDLTYSDEDKINAEGTSYVEPFFKPDWSPEYFRGVMYVGHLLCVRKDLVLKVGGLDSNYDGIQDYELVLRISETAPKIAHIPKILYHWRKVIGSISADIQAKPGIDKLQESAVNAHLKRLGLKAIAQGLGGHRVGINPVPKDNYPLISIIIPTRDAPHHLGRCLESLFTLSKYPNFEVLLIDNDTTDQQALNIMRQYPVKRVFLPNPFNYSRANNLGFQYSEGDYLVFLNNDTEVISQDWLQNLLYYAEHPEIGAAGALLLYPDRTVQHAGVVMGFRGTADHVMRGFQEQWDGYAGSLRCARDVSAVTAACLMVSRQDFEKIGGFDEHYFHHYQDVDLCLKLLELGRRNIYTPRAALIHHESATRKSYYDLVDRYLLLDQWGNFIESGDPYFNPNFTLERHDYTVKVQ